MISPYAKKVIVTRIAELEKVLQMYDHPSNYDAMVICKNASTQLKINKQILEDDLRLTRIANLGKNE